jgi:hypothetical protein
VVRCGGGYSYGNCPQSGAEIAIAGEDSDVIMSDSQIVRGERGGTPYIALLANSKKLVCL